MEGIKIKHIRYKQQLTNITFKMTVICILNFVFQSSLWVCHTSQQGHVKPNLIPLHSDIPCYMWYILGLNGPDDGLGW